MKIQVLGVPWYKEDEYEMIKAVMSDWDKLPATFTDWFRAAKKVKETAERQGVVAVEAYINPVAFVAWCRARHLNVDAGARVEYANIVAYETYKKGIP